MAEKKKRRWGDRKDGRLVRTMPPLMKVTPFIMVERSDACNQFKDEIEVTKAEEYIREKRKSGLSNFSMLHMCIAAYVRTVSQRPGLNRFVSGQRIYSRDQVEVNLAIKKELSEDGEESIVSVLIDPSATAEEVYNILNDVVVSTRCETSNFDTLAKVIDMIPRLVKKFFIWFLRTLDYFGLLPYKLTRLSPFHGSFFITSMASLGLTPIYHHIYNFGNVPIFLAYGRTEKRYVPQKDGTFVEKRMMGFSLVMDERIADGFYFSTAFRMFSGVFRNPAQLDEAPETVVKDID